jgi:glycosyltransferase involved in cell wall biosynthesis
MKNEPRINLLINNENKGQFHGKMQGVLKAKGEYILCLDQDNYYVSKYAFSVLYEESKKNDLDLLGFSSIVAGFINITVSSELTIGEYLNYIGTSIIYKPNIKERYLNLKLKKAESSTSSCLYLIKRTLFLKVINLLRDEFFNRNIDEHEDTIFIYLLSRNARSLKHIKRIFHTVFAWPETPIKKFQYFFKKKKREETKCYSFLTYIRALLLFSENNKEDKKMASTVLHLFLKNPCTKNTTIDTVKDSKNLCYLFLNNTYINIEIKNEIMLYLNEINHIE